jgi:hypothetical protein
LQLCGEFHQPIFSLSLSYCELRWLIVWLHEI